MQSLSDSPAADFGDTHKMGPGSVAALSLVAANAGLLFLYLAFDLTLFQLVFVYWFEALWVGLFSGLKLLTASVFGDPFNNRWVHVSRGSSLFLSLFAIVKSAGAFFLLLILTGVALVVAQEALTGTAGSDFLRDQLGLLFKCSLLFLFGHGLSFIINFLILGEFRTARFTTLLILPFKRAFALFVAIVASLTAIQAFPGLLNDTMYAGSLIVVKLSWDYFLHRRERLSLSTSGLLEESRD